MLAKRSHTLVSVLFRDSSFSKNLPETSEKSLLVQRIMGHKATVVGSNLSLTPFLPVGSFAELELVLLVAGALVMSFRGRH